jgi:hypothetical protein
MADAGVTALRDDLARQCSASRWGEAAAVVVLLSFEPVAGDRRFARHAAKTGIDWTAVLKDKGWSPSERFLIATAAGLWTGRAHGADVYRVPFLGDGYYAVWLAMVTASRTGKVAGDG